MSRRPPQRRIDALPDETLVLLARGGDQEAFATIVARYHGPLLGMARRLGAEHRAEDFVQQTFLSVLVAFRSGTEVRHLRGWLHQILRHTAYRLSGPVELALEADLELSPLSVEDTVERRLATRQVLSAMASLPSRQREAMVATALEGQSRAAIAGAMGLSEGAVRQLMHRARQALRAAAYSLVPWPVHRWLTRAGAGPSGDQGPAIAAAASTPLPGAAAKLAAIVASGALAAGYLTPSTATNLTPGVAASRAQHAVGASRVRPGASVLADGQRAQLAAAVSRAGALASVREGDRQRGRHHERRGGEHGASGHDGSDLGGHGGGDSGSGSGSASDGRRSDDAGPQPSSTRGEGSGDDGVSSRGPASPTSSGDGGPARQTSGSPDRNDSGGGRDPGNGDPGSGTVTAQSDSGQGPGSGVTTPPSTSADTSAGGALSSGSPTSPRSGRDGGSGSSSSPSSDGAHTDSGADRDLLAGAASSTP